MAISDGESGSSVRTKLNTSLAITEGASTMALAALTPAADKVPYYDGASSAALASLTSFARTLLDDADASTALTTLGVSTYAKTLLDDTTASAALTTLGVSTYGKTLLDDATAGDALTTLGVSTYAKTLLDDASAGDALTTLGVTTYAKTLLDDADASAARTTLDLVKQTSTIDTTVSRLMLTGAFGWGLNNSLNNDVTDLDAHHISGAWRFSASATGAPTTDIGTFIHINRAIDSAARSQVQLAFYGVSGVPIMSVRQMDSGTWGAWQLIYDQQNVLGTVSQSSGVPTGALIEKGNSANGYYRKFACGFMECWHTKTASSGAATTWTFPGGAFTEAPVVTGTAVATTMLGVVLDAAPSTTAATYSVRNTSDTRTATSTHLRATGRWSTLA